MKVSKFQARVFQNLTWQEFSESSTAGLVWGVLASVLWAAACGLTGCAVDSSFEGQLQTKVSSSVRGCYVWSGQTVTCDASVGQVFYGASGSECTCALGEACTAITSRSEPEPGVCLRP